jgi:hypothetical protein
LAPFLHCASGLPGFVGPFPSTSLDESDITHNSFVCVRGLTKHCLTLYIFYGKDRLIVNCKKHENRESTRITAERYQFPGCRSSEGMQEHQWKIFLHQEHIIESRCQTPRN